MASTENNIFFSPSKAAFYLASLKTTYGNAWPIDATAVTDDVHAQFTQQPPAGQALGAANGQPAWVAATAAPGVPSQLTMTQQADAVMSALAAAWGFNQGVDAATTWVTSGNAQWAAEAKALAVWRDAVRAWLLTTPASMATMPAAPTRPGDSA